MKALEMDTEYPKRKEKKIKSVVPKPFPKPYPPVKLHPDFKAELAHKKPMFLKLSHNNHSCSSLASNADMKLVGMRVFSTIMLNAWRRRREEVKLLIEKVENLKKASMKSNNEIHIFNTLFRVEQKRNDKLTCQLKRSLESINHAKSSCESLTTSIISLKADNSLLEQQLHTKFKEFNALKAVLAQTKSDLFRSIIEQRRLRNNLYKEQSNNSFLENQKSKLIDEICELGSESRNKEKQYRKELEERNLELKNALERLAILKKSVAEFQEKENIERKCIENEENLRNKIADLRTCVFFLKASIATSMGNRIRYYWEKTHNFRQKSINLAYIVSFYMLPATPPPKFTFPFPSDEDCL